ncbi:MAG: DNA mismatch repair protein MutS [Spirochaetales bacterium]
MALSPMMMHYLSTKENYKDAILFYRLGDFYEMFFEDAITVSKALDLTLTSKACGLDEKAPMCGVPAKSVDFYIAKLIELGFKVAICEQLTEPTKGQMVERDVIRVVTPGTIMEESILDDKKNNYIASVYKNKTAIGLSYADITTGEFYTIEFDNIDSLKLLNDMLVMIKPSEIISNDEMFLDSYNLDGYKLGVLPKFFAYSNSAYDKFRASKNLKDQFNVSSLQIFDLEDKKFAIISAGALIEYLNETQKRSLSHINKIELLRDNYYMYLDVNTRKNLEITETIRDRKKRGSLLWLLDNTNTSMGARTLRNWVDQPLQNENEINLRLNGVEELHSSLIKRESIAKELAKINDIERLAGKISYGSINPRDCLGLLNSLKELPTLKHTFKNSESEILNNIYNKIDNFSSTVVLLENAIDEDAPSMTKDGGYIKKGYNAELDELKSAGVEGKNWIAKLEAEEKEQTGIKNLKIGFNRVFGYYLEVTNSQKDMVPFRYQRKQTLTGGERYITEELKNLEDKILGSEEKALKLELEIFNEIKAELLKSVSALQNTAKQIAKLDVLTSLATVAANNNYCKPEVSSKINSIEIVDGRHPVIEKLLTDGEFVPNDTHLDTLEDRTMIITGPNMAGKSTYMRQVALITLMAHIGSFVPAKSAKISLTDRIFTRVGATDDLASNQSTFMVEMVEVANILNNATSKSLIILDEIGRGTSTFDGLSIAWSVMEYVSKHLNAKTLFSTHYHELTELEGILDGVKNYRINVKEFAGGILFLRKIVRGGANKSFGIEVADLAGLPKEVTLRAKQILNRLEESDINKNNLASLKDERKENVDAVNRYQNEIINLLKESNIENLSPLEAFGVLQNLIEKVKKG